MGVKPKIYKPVGNSVERIDPLGNGCFGTYRMSFTDFQKAFKRIKDGHGGILDIGFLAGYVTEQIAVRYDEDGKFDRMVVKPTFDDKSFKLHDACLVGPRNKGLTLKVKKKCTIILQVLQNHKVARKMDESRTETPIMLLKKKMPDSMADPFTISFVRTDTDGIT